MIAGFHGEHRWLSNFWSVQISGSELTYPSAEHAYQAAKCINAEDRELFTAGTAGEAKRLGRKVKSRPDWTTARVPVMLAVLHRKFARGTQLAAKLIATGSEELIEANTWGDVFWGQCRGVGENHLGKLLMQVRAELLAVS